MYNLTFIHPKVSDSIDERCFLSLVGRIPLIMTTTPPQRSDLIALISGSLERLLALNNQMTSYSSDSELQWRELEGGQLLSARFGLRAALASDLLYVFGGYGDEEDNPERLLSSILYWDQVALTWQSRC